MKKMTTLLSMLLMLVTLTVNAQSWSFATVSTDDKTNLDADKTNWTYDGTNNRWAQQATLNDEAP